MRKIGVLILMAISFSSYSQNLESYTVKGTVKDSVNMILPYTTAVILSEKDSTLVNYAVSNDFGVFEMIKVKPANYILQLSFMGFKTFSRKITIKGKSPVVNLGNIALVSNTNNLDEFTVEGQYIPIVFKKDTVEYNANAFKTNKNANVEKLLTKMPGIEVDEDGEITAHGETVSKILVDGKEFFGDDPKIASKNIPADAVDKIQVFDKKSELAEFTGVDDGERNRTINIILKKDRKKGYFGNAEVGGGYENKYKGKLNLNRFSQTAQFTSLLMANNINEQGFSYQDYFNFMGGISNVMKTGKMNFDPSSSGVPINTPGANNGVASTIAGGINYNQDFGSKTHFISSGFVNNSNSDILRNTSSTNYLRNSSYTSQSNENQNQNLQNYRLNTKLQHEFNDKNRLDINMIGIYSLSNADVLSSEEKVFSDAILNNANSTTQTYGEGINTTVSFDYKKRFAKKGRSINVLADLYYLKNNNRNTVATATGIKIDTSNLVTSSLLQEQNSLSNKLDYFGKIAITEQISKKMFIVTDYSYYSHNQIDDKVFYDIVGQSKNLNSILSNNFNSNYQYHQLGMKLNYKLNRNMFVLGVDGQLSNLQGTVNENPDEINQDFQVLLPNFYWKKQKGMANRIEIRYKTTFSEPSISQLQPVVNNSNPLNIYIGNPNLRPEYNHTVTFNWHKFDMFSHRHVGVYVNTYLIDNKITNAQYFNSITNLQTSTPENVQDNLGTNVNLSYGFRVNKIKSRFRTSASFGLNRGYSVIDGKENLSSTFNYGGRLTWSNSNKTIMDARIGISTNVNQNEIELGAQKSSQYVNTKIFGHFDFELKKEWEIGVKGTQNFYRGKSLSNVQDFFLLDVYVTKSVLKNGRGTLKLGVYDILNQRTGISNYGQGNYLIESKVNVLRRYAMLSFVYKIIKI